MRWIRLFEAFNYDDEIYKANHLFLCYCVKEFIKYEKLESKLFYNRFKIYREFDSFDVRASPTGYGVYFQYRPRDDCFWMYCELKSYLKDKGIEPSRSYWIIKPSLEQAAKQVVKKMYKDEKNKTTENK